MTDPECTQFLQWCLPRLRLRWAGFRKVRKQVCKRLSRRLNELGVSDLSLYRSYLSHHPDEWHVLDRMCRITISRFYRDRRVWDMLRTVVLPSLARDVTAAGEDEIRCWSAGCGSGEEPYTLNMVWRLAVLPESGSSLRLRIVATDSNPGLFERALRGVYIKSTLKHLPQEWVDLAFDPGPDGYAIREDFKSAIEFIDEDIRKQMPEGPFHLVLCRNLVFTYFEDSLQAEVLDRVAKRIRTGGVLVVGVHESIPAKTDLFEPFERVPGTYIKKGSYP